jgi:hypothetical protein
MKEAYERTGGFPEEAAFTSSDAADVRGLPVWRQDEWAQE